jgi:hypothetical protein
MVPPAAATLAPAAAQHGVAGDPAAEPRPVGVVAHRGDGPAPFVARAHRVPGVALSQVGHLAGEELDVGAAHAGPLDVDHGLAGRGHRVRDIGDRGPAAGR